VASQSLPTDVGGGIGDSTPAAGTQEAGTPEAVGTTTGTQEAGTPEAEGTAATGTETEDMVLVRASELIGSQIVDMNNETVGTVEDVLVDEAGMIQYVVFDANAFLQGTGGTGGTDSTDSTPAPAGTNDQSTQVVGTIEAVTPDVTTPDATVAAGTQEVGTPEAEGTTTTGTDTEVQGGVLADEDTVLVFNGDAEMLQSQGIMISEEMLDAEGVTFAATGTDTSADMAQLEGLLRVSQLTNFNVMNAQDEELGQVEEWIVDLEQGMIQYGVVDFGGFLGIAENTVAVPFEQFTVNTTGATAADASLTLDVDQETLENAPQLDMSSWEAWPNPIPTDWETETRTFWETAS
jgi:sporulation protein YlmC with PRC-barrel domain